MAKLSENLYETICLTFFAILTGGQRWGLYRRDKHSFVIDVDKMMTIFLMVTDSF